jgi:hypothetical protein
MYVLPSDILLLSFYILYHIPFFYFTRVADVHRGKSPWAMYCASWMDKTSSLLLSYAGKEDPGDLAKGRQDARHGRMGAGFVETD